MALCQACQQDKPKTFRCGRCRAVQYCSKDCQRTAWNVHKPICAAHVSNQATVAPATQMAVLLGEGFSAKSILIPPAPVHIPLIRQYFSQHKQSKDCDFTDVLMPVSDRLFGRPMRIVYDQSCSGQLQPNTFAIRDACNLHNSMGPDIRGQALVYDPSGKDINVGDYMCFDDQVCNVVQSFFEQQGFVRPTEVQLDRLRRSCQSGYDCERPNYKDSGSMYMPDFED